MSTRERTIQQHYPLGAMTGRPVTLAAAVAAPVYGVVLAWRNQDDIVSPALALASLVLVCAASFTLVMASSGLRAPFSAQSSIFVIIWANAGMALGAASMWGSDQLIRDDWGPIGVGLAIVALAPYRPPREIAAYGILSAILAGFIAVLQAPTLIRPGPTIVFVVIAVTPIAILTIAAAQFTKTVLSAVDRWQRQTHVAVTADNGDSDWIARSVQQDRVTILNRDVVPFFAQVLHEGEVSVIDAERARDISDDIRAVMVAEADRSWLHTVIDQAIAARHDEWLAPDALVDEDRLAPRMNLDQRSALRAFIAALFSHPDFGSRGFQISLQPDGDLVSCTIQARLDCSETQLRSEFAPYFAVMRILFADLSFEFVQPVLTLQFSYDD